MISFWKKMNSFVGSFIQQDPEKITEFFSKKKKALKFFCKGSKIKGSINCYFCFVCFCSAIWNIYAALITHSYNNISKDMSRGLKGKEEQ